MTRPKLRLKFHLDTEELKVQYRSCKNAKEARRWHVLWLISQGYSAKEAAESVGLGVSWVREIINRYNTQGPESIRDQHLVNPGGKRPRLNASQQEELLEALKNPPDGGGVWTGAKVADWIQQKTGIETYPQLGWVYLRNLDPRIKSRKRSRMKGALAKASNAS